MNLDAQLAAMIGDDGIKVPGLGVIVYKNGREVYANFFGRRHQISCGVALENVHRLCSHATR